jgi:hypothetical protein
MAAEDQALADLSAAVTTLGTAVAAEITALQAALAKQGVDNSPAIEKAVSNISALVNSLTNSLPTTGGGTPTAPAITTLSPNTGPAAGGTTVNATGTGFTGATDVSVGGTPATGLTVNSDTTLTFTTPAGAVGPASVTVTTPAGMSVSGPLALFTFA